MSARTSYTTFVHPSICSSPVTKSPVQPDLFQMLQLIHLSHLIRPIHPTRLIHPNRFEKTSGVWKLIKFTVFSFLQKFPPFAVICRYFLSFSVYFCANFRWSFCHCLRKGALETKNAWHPGSQDPPFPRPCDHRSWRSRQFSTLVQSIVCFFEMI